MTAARATCTGLTKLLYQAEELALGWNRKNWEDQGVFAEGPAAFDNARSATSETRLRLEREYTTLYTAAGARLKACAESTDIVTSSGVSKVMKAALGRLGYTWKETSGVPLPENRGKPLEVGGYLTCNADAYCIYQLIFPTHSEYNMPGKMGVDYAELQVGAAATPEEAQRVVREEQDQDKDFKAGTHRGLAAGFKSHDGSAGSADMGWGWDSERVLVVSGGNVMIKVTRVAGCATVKVTNICGSARTVDMPTKDADALLDEAVLGGLIPPGALK